MEQRFALPRLLASLSPTPAQYDAALDEIEALRARLFDGLNGHVTEVLLQGSLRRDTAIHPLPGEALEVDVLIITDIPRESATPEQALRLFLGFLRSHYSRRWAIRGRIVTISATPLRLKLALVAAPVPADLGLSAWGKEPLYIPNREASRWEPTHPLAQLAWTEAKNARCNGHYVDVVRAIKSWRRTLPNLPKGRSYPLEHVVGLCCPDDIRSPGEGIVQTFEEMVMRFEPSIVRGRRPSLPSHGLPAKDVLARCSPDEFASVIRAASQAASLAKRALREEIPSESARLWRELLDPQGPRF